VCAEITRETGLDQLLFLGGDMSSPEGVPDSVAAATFESIIGAIYVDGGYEPANRFIASHTLPRIEQVLDNIHHQNCKSLLQQYAQQRNLAPPEYIVLDEKGPDHSKCFEIAASVGNRHFQSAWGKNKKDAEQEAAYLALLELGAIDERPCG
jgi:ribonuclease-3